MGPESTRNPQELFHASKEELVYSITLVELILTMVLIDCTRFRVSDMHLGKIP